MAEALAEASVEASGAPAAGGSGEAARSALLALKAMSDGEAAEALRLQQRAIGACQGLGLGPAINILDRVRAIYLLHAGEGEEAAAQLAQLAVASERLGSLDEAAEAHLLRAVVLLSREGFAAAEESFKATERLAEPASGLGSVVEEGRRLAAQLRHLRAPQATSAADVGASQQAVASLIKLCWMRAVGAQSQALADPPAAAAPLRSGGAAVEEEEDYSSDFDDMDEPTALYDPKSGAS